MRTTGQQPSGTAVGRRSILFIISLAMAGCGRTATGPSPLDAGMWGGDHVAMTVSDTATHLEFDCAHGDISGRLTSSDGAIAANGTYVREHGGPIRVDEPVDPHPALYSGKLTGQMLQLTI